LRRFHPCVEDGSRAPKTGHFALWTLARGWSFVFIITAARISLTGVLLALGLVLISLGSSASSVGAVIEPTVRGKWSDFANCPADALVLIFGSQCVHSYTTGGVVQIGHSNVPISLPGDTLDLGVTGQGTKALTMSPPHGILNGPAQPVPGGLLGVVGDARLTGVSAKIEWAKSIAPESIFGFTEDCSGTNPLITFDLCRVLHPSRGTAATLGTAVTLSIKFHLLSPFLGSNCYIGSSTNPIVIPLITGSTVPVPPAHSIHGKSLEYLRVLPGSAGGVIEQALGITLVNNSFSVPGASGCGTSGTQDGELVDASINHKLGLPSPPGQNAIAISAVGEQASPAEVLVHGWTGE
jgi:hypothetical protein